MATFVVVLDATPPQDPTAFVIAAGRLLTQMAIVRDESEATVALFEKLERAAQALDDPAAIGWLRQTRAFMKAAAGDLVTRRIP